MDLVNDFPSRRGERDVDVLVRLRARYHALPWHAQPKIRHAPRAEPHSARECHRRLVPERGERGEVQRLRFLQVRDEQSDVSDGHILCWKQKETSLRAFVSVANVECMYEVGVLKIAAIVALLYMSLLFLLPRSHVVYESSHCFLSMFQIQLVSPSWTAGNDCSTALFGHVLAIFDILQEG
jgi:hypothetical protein